MSAESTGSELTDDKAADLVDSVQHAADPALTDDEHEMLERVQRHLRGSEDTEEGHK